jgi:hypothetical protein
MSDNGLWVMGLVLSAVGLLCSGIALTAIWLASRL